MVRQPLRARGLQTARLTLPRLLSNQRSLVKVVGKRYTGRVAGKGSDLNKRLRVECLEESGTKGDKCARLAAYMLKSKIPLNKFRGAHPTLSI